MRIPRALLLSTLVTALAVLSIAPGAGAAAGPSQRRGPRAGGWYSESNPGPVNGSYIPIR